MGISARLYALAHKWSNELADCYQVIQQVHLAYPYGSKTKEHPNQCDATTMKNERAKAERWIENRLSFKSPVHFEFFLTHRTEDIVQEKDNTMDSNAVADASATVDDDDLGGKSTGVDCWTEY